jgi:hypothetical protein
MLNVRTHAPLFRAFRAGLEFINASRHAFKKTAKNCLIWSGPMDNLGTIHRDDEVVYKEI